MMKIALRRDVVTRAYNRLLRTALHRSYVYRPIGYL